MEVPRCRSLQVVDVVEAGEQLVLVGSRVRVTTLFPPYCRGKRNETIFLRSVVLATAGEEVTGAGPGVVIGAKR